MRGWFKRKPAEIDWGGPFCDEITKARRFARRENKPMWVWVTASGDVWGGPRRDLAPPTAVLVIHVEPNYTGGAT